MSTVRLELVTCRCNNCDGNIQFERDKSGSRIECPRCGMETLLFIPPAPVGVLIPEAPKPQPVLPPPAYNPSNEDFVFLYEGGVIVTKTRFMVSGQTYAISKITSVSPEKIPASNVGPALLGLAGAVAIMVAIGGKEEFGLPGSVLLGLLGLLGIIASVYISVKQKPFYAVALRTSSGELKVCMSKDGDFIVRIANALNQAIVARG